MTQPVYLAIETSTQLGSIAIGHGRTVLAEVVLGLRVKQSEALLPAIEYALDSAHLTQTDLARIVVGGGPGSFTGLRVAGATAKAMARALDIPMFAYSGLEALAASTANPDRTICAMFDARRDEVYSACYRFPAFGSIEVLMPPAPRHIEDVLTRVDARTAVFVGDGALRHADVITATGGLIAPAHFAVPRAAALLWLSDLVPAHGRVENIGEWEPLYLRESGAERSLQK
jgi:tRNA threonylcarbamoyladenosine biosynthesis protein TsaB